MAGFCLALAVGGSGTGTAAVASVVVPVDRAAAAGIFEITHSWSANVGDYNRDGWSDVMLVRHFQAGAILYRNNKNGTFTSVRTFPAGPPDRHDCAWGNVNADLYIDLYCTSGAAEGTVVKSNELYIQKPAGVFTNRAAEFGVTDPLGRGRYATFIDVNHDKYPDLFVGNATPRTDGQPTPNRLFINQGGTRFVDSPAYGLNVEAGANCAQAADVNKDGWQDLLVCGKNGIKLYRNVGGTQFADITAASSLSGAWADAELVDLNKDGRLDIAQVRAATFQIRLQNASGVFGPPTGVLGLQLGQKVEAGDVNLDGRKDIYVLQGDTHPDLMLVQDSSQFTFTQIPVVQPPLGPEGDPPLGSGDAVAAIDFDRNGVTDYIVMNGEGKAQGPVQLITFL